MDEQNKMSFIEELQSLGEPTKRKILIGATAVIMVAVVYLWLGYFNGLVAASSQTPIVAAQDSQSGGSATQAQVQPQQGVGAIIGGFFSNIIGDFRHLFQSPGQYNINPSK